MQGSMPHRQANFKSGTVRAATEVRFSQWVDPHDRTALTAPEVRGFARMFLAGCAERWTPTTRKTYAFNVRR